MYLRVTSIFLVNEIHFSLSGGWLSGKMKRDVGAPPEGSRVHFQSQPGRKPQQSGPDWRSLAEDDRTWKVLDVCEKIAKNKGKSVAQVRTILVAYLSADCLLVCYAL